MDFQREIELAANLIRAADAILIGAGAGMGVDSGLPDFRGDEGFWKAYPPFKKLGLNFFDLADPVWFDRNPRQAWGFYGHRFNLYQNTEPHNGFAILKRWMNSCKAGGFVFTSNVDGHFQAAGIQSENVVECHGSFECLQCSQPCDDSIWEAMDLIVKIDEASFLAAEPLPVCLNCGKVARPNILMFGDGAWLPSRTEKQLQRYGRWLSTLHSELRVVVVELGAGTAVPTVRWECQRQSQQLDATLIRINPRECQVPDGAIGIPLGALGALEKIEDVFV